jgi:hypothetical protein
MYDLQYEGKGEGFRGSKNVRKCQCKGVGAMEGARAREPHINLVIKLKQKTGVVSNCMCAFGGGGATCVVLGLGGWRYGSQGREVAMKD